jgi:DNA topoisomerase-3
MTAEARVSPELFRLKLKRNEDLGFRALVKEATAKKKGKKKGDSRSEAGMTCKDFMRECLHSH